MSFNGTAAPCGSIKSLPDEEASATDPSVVGISSRAFAQDGSDGVVPHTIVVNTRKIGEVIHRIPLNINVFDNLPATRNGNAVSVFEFVENLLDATYAEPAIRFGTSPSRDRVSVDGPGHSMRFGLGTDTRH